MKLSGRELIMVFALIFIVLIAGFYFLFLSPIQSTLNAKMYEYDTLHAQYVNDKSIIDSVEGLTAAESKLKDDISAAETKLLPKLDSEIITEHLITIFADNGFSYTTSASATLPSIMQFVENDGSNSDNAVQWVDVTLRVSGTDGVTPGGIPKVGFTEFMKAVKVIEAENPSAMRVYSIDMEETSEGFQYFNITVRVYAFDLPTRVSTVDTTDKYITWSRDPVALGGVFGIPYEFIPQSQISSTFFKPFASTSAAASSPDSAAGTTPTEAPAA